MDDWEIKMLKSQKEHKHNVVVGGLAENIGKVKYCYVCDQFYYPEEK